MPPYATRLKRHLAEYKTSKLGIAENGVWLRNKAGYSHILPQSAFTFNVLEPIGERFWTHANAGGLAKKLHRDFHHLTSSQALAFNLFFPTLEGLSGNPTALLQALGVGEKTLASAEFEAVPDAQERTNFDFLATFTDNTRLLVEVKLSESEFGRCNLNDTYKGRLETIYRGRLLEKAKETLLPKAFFPNYQLFRNLSHLKRGDTLALVVPRANTKTFAQAERFVDSMTTDEWRSSVRVFALEDLLATLHAHSHDSASREVALLLQEKYVID